MKKHNLLCSSSGNLNLSLIDSSLFTSFSYFEIDKMTTISTPFFNKKIFDCLFWFDSNDAILYNFFAFEHKSFWSQYKDFALSLWYFVKKPQIFEKDCKSFAMIQYYLVKIWKDFENVRKTLVLVLCPICMAKYFKNHAYFLYKFCNNLQSHKIANAKHGNANKLYIWYKMIAFIHKLILIDY